MAFPRIAHYFNDWSVSVSIPHWHESHDTQTFNKHGITLRLRCAICCHCMRWQSTEGTTLLVGRQEEHPACKNWVVRYWRGYLSGARCKWFAYGPADATATPSSLTPVKSRMVCLSGAVVHLLTQVVLESGRSENRRPPQDRMGSCEATNLSLYE